MVDIGASGTLTIATIVWIVWRVILARRSGLNLAREIVVTVWFAIALLMVAVTLFPLKIIFYDWGSVVSLVPFASIAQLITETPTVVAVENIAGNILLFMPLGLFLPLLFVELRRFGALMWRAAVVSVVIEAAQLVTRARSVDIDDVILNITGAALGFGVYMAVAAVARRTSNGLMLLERLGSTPGREPLLLAAAPIAATALIAIPLILSSIIDGTLSRQEMLTIALYNSPGVVVVAEASVEEQWFIMVAHPSSPSELIRYDFERVLPSRFTWLGSSRLSSRDGSRYTWNITPFNTVKNELPKVLLWGVNRAGAATATLSGNGIVETLQLPEELYFVVGFNWDIEAFVAPSESIEDFAVTFASADGTDVSDQFDSER